jgi:hypothetical protein
LADQQVGGKGHPVGQVVDRKESDLVSIGTGPQGSPGLGPPKTISRRLDFLYHKKKPGKFPGFLSNALFVYRQRRLLLRLKLTMDEKQIAHCQMI